MNCKKFPETLKIQNNDENNSFKERILLCTGGGCLASGALDLKEILINELKKNNLESKVAIVETGCLGPCAGGPVMIMEKSGIFYQHLTSDDIPEIIESHIIKGKVVERLCYKDGKHEKPIPLKNEIDFFKKQSKVVLKNCGEN